VQGDRPQINVAGEGDEKNPKGNKALDPKQIWENALAQGVDQPATYTNVAIATTDFLAQNGKFDHAAEFLKANLRQGLVVRPWVYQSLAIALRQSGGSAEEIERAEVSAADLESLDARGYLVAARALAEDKNYERALAFCRQAADLQPGTPHAYSDAARYAEMAGDAVALQWAAGKLLARDWPARNAEVQDQALQKVEALARRLEQDRGDKLKSTVARHRQRDLVIKLLWQGESGLDLKVLEPSGSVCDSLNRQSVGGGTVLASGPSNPNGATYTAAQAFPGEYRITVEKVWGKPLGNKVQVRIIQHQGTEDETEQVVTLKMVSNISDPITVNLAKGRRTEAAYVAPQAAQQRLDATAEMTGNDGDAVLSQLRRLADPEVTGTERGRKGGVVAPGRPPARPTAGAVPKSTEKDRTLYQSRVAPFVANSVDVTAQAVISADRRYVRLSLSVAGTIARPGLPPRVISPVVPQAVLSNPDR
jgi:tetratricopeptide (TPR) repeat protein